MPSVKTGIRHRTRRRLRIIGPRSANLEDTDVCQFLFVMLVNLAVVLTRVRPMLTSVPQANYRTNILTGRVSQMPARIGYFTIISGIGWLIDFFIFTVSIKVGLTAAYANLFSASVAVIFVFVTSRQWIFRHHAGSLRSVIVKYVLWNLFAVSLASWGVGTVHGLFSSSVFDFLEFVRSNFFQTPITVATLSAIAAKVFITPFTMYSNFVVLGYILEKRVHYY